MDFIVIFLRFSDIGCHIGKPLQGAFLCQRLYTAVCLSICRVWPGRD